MRLGDFSVHFASEEQIEGLRGNGSLHVAEIGGAIRSQEDLFRELARVLEFPDYFGHNWEAVNDCLMDLDAEEPVALVMHNALALWSHVPEEMAKLVDVWIDASMDRGGDLHLIFVR